MERKKNCFKSAAQEIREAQITRNAVIVIDEIQNVIEIM